MKASSVLILFVFFAASFTPPPAHSAPTPAPRKSADGIDLPAAVPERKFHSTVPLAAGILGQKPEDVGRVFNSRKSSALLAKRTTVDLGCDWFVVNVAGADLAGLSLTDGRVSKLVLFYESVTPTKLAGLHKQVEGHVDHAVKAALKPIEHDKKQSLMITFEADPIEFYVATHTVSAQVADAMRHRTWLAEMTDEQAILIGDGPGKYAAIFAPDNKGDITGAGTVFADSGPADIRIEIEARNKQDARAQALKRHKNLKDLTKITASDMTANSGKAK